MLSEINQIKKKRQVPYDFMCKWNLMNKINSQNKIETDSQIQNRLTAIRGEGVWGADEKDEGIK